MHKGRLTISLAMVAISLISAFDASADEGMWLPSLIGQRIGDMQAKGFKLSAEDIYSINSASLKDAVVLFGGGCTGEIVSDQGLLLTNHHCGYSHIQKHSSVEHDYLRDGFWAMDRKSELPCPGLWVRILERMEDVTSIVLQGYSEGMEEENRQKLVSENSAKLVREATADGNGLVASVEAMFYGNSYYLFVYRQYDDVRLVGAPPSSIGKFGGDTDNWMWPRHTGDFSMFRIYADAQNNPAPYSEGNRPYRPKRFFRINDKGVNEGDFTFIYGFPGKTREYIHSAEVGQVARVSDPQKIALRTLRLDIQKKHMAQSQDIRIRYSAKNANVANAWKKWQGESAGLVKNRTEEEKKAYEERFEAWAKGTEYEGVTLKLGELLRELARWENAIDLYSESAYTVEMAKMADNYFTMKDPPLDAFYKDWYLPIDKESFVAVMEVFDREIEEGLKPQWYLKQMKKFKSVGNWADHIFGKSAFRDRSLVSKADKKDPAYQFYTNMYDWYSKELRPQQRRLQSEIDLLYRLYMKGQMEFGEGGDFYPDANLTLRVAYGKVGGYSPADGIWYKPVSTLKGIIEKDNPEVFDYNIPQVLRDIYAEGGHENQPVCFIATNHTTGGNSGSPVIDGDGNLIGINFDRVWEGTMSDICFDPDICRNISLDIRYLLFVVRNVGHAGHLIDEMVFAD